jgi:hypothetical protein
MAVTMKIAVFKDVTPCSFVCMHQRFRGHAVSIFMVEE